MKTPEEILASKGIQFPANRSPRDYNLTLIAMEDYASQFYSEEQLREALKLSECSKWRTKSIMLHLKAAKQQEEQH